MEFKKFKSLLSKFLCVMLIVAIAITVSGCSSKQNDTDVNQGTGDVIVVGEGDTEFIFQVVDSDKNETLFEIHTDKEIVGDALLENELIEGEEGPYGLYVKKVNGIEADFDKDQTYWAFYVDGEFASKGVDQTEITEGSTYSFKVEK